MTTELKTYKLARYGIDAITMGTDDNLICRWTVKDTKEMLSKWECKDCVECKRASPEWQEKFNALWESQGKHFVNEEWFFTDFKD